MSFQGKILASLSAITVTVVMSTSAFAEKFTFEASGEVTGQVGVPAPDGTVIGGSSLSGTTNIVWASGNKESNDYTCMSMSRPPSELFAIQGICNAKNAAGDEFGTLFGCNYTNEERTESNCVGGMTGMTGALAGKNGTMSWHGTPEGSSGSGQWND